MQLVEKTTAQNLYKTGVAAIAGLALLPVFADPPAGPDARPTISPAARKTINAGTVFRFDFNTGQHEVRGIAQVSNLGNCRVYFDVIATPCGGDGQHFLCAEGTMTLTTLAGDKLETSVVGWLDFDPNDPKVPPSMGKFHYDVTVTGGTGKLAGARGHGAINGASMFVGPDGPDDTDPTDDGFCDGYVGVATWLYDGVLLLPHPSDP
ncbi:MAG: hypothetical protein HS113_12805 [Verrucomicrobiales bacterium]|nr:hypothetical protein [Verrucomicrobiales bacterium]